MSMPRFIATAGLTALTILGSLGSANAARYDGSWNMIAQTTRGHCGVISISFGVERGRSSSTGGSFAFYPINLDGRVTSGGRVKMRAIAGPRTAYGVGRFGAGRAEGTWQGRGPSGLCSGVWSASRS
jgi:hypothetical protein